MASLWLRPALLRTASTRCSTQALQQTCRTFNPLHRRVPLGQRTLTSVNIDQLGETKLRRSYLYVPSSSERMLESSLKTPSDVIVYDLEDSVAPSEKDAARSGLEKFLSRMGSESGSGILPSRERVAVRINATTTPQFSEDMEMIARSPQVSIIVVPKVDCAADLDLVSSFLPPDHEESVHSVDLVASIESPQALWDIGHIAGWHTDLATPRAILSALLFAAEDYCANTSIIRTSTRQELLYTRSRIVAAAKAHRLDAIDMVCINYKDQDILRDECEDARRLGYDGKQAIHPSQVEIIQNTFLPTAQEIRRAVEIVRQMEISHQEKLGAFGLDDGKGGKEMIDAPMLKQAYNVLRKAKAAKISLTEH